MSDERAVRALHVDGYRSLLGVELELGSVTVLTGPNGSGKTNLYRALRILHACGTGTLGRAVATEGGMPSILHAGRRDGRAEVRIGVDLADDLGYQVTLMRVGPGGSFEYDPAVDRELVTVAAGRRKVELLDRAGSTAFARDDDGNRITMAVAFHTSETALARIADHRSFPELAVVRRTLEGMRFHHHLRTDDDAPARRPFLATRTLAVADDGSDLAAALATVHADGDRGALDRLVHDAFGGARLVLVPGEQGMVGLALELPHLLRTLGAAEMSDGQLRFLFLAAALLSPRPPALVVLNEPEASLHEDMLGPLADLITTASEQTQVVVTTHAPALAEALGRVGGATAYALEGPTGSTTVRPL